MTSLQEIKNRINSIKTTKKITKAMKLIASAKLKSSRKNLEAFNEYANSIEKIFNEVNTYYLNEKEKIFSSKTLFIVITSDIGLCGSYNTNVINLLLKNLNINDKIIIFGNKGISNLKNRKINTTLDIPNIGDVVDYEKVLLTTKKALILYNENKVGRIKIIYTKFINSINFNPYVKKLLPIENVEKNIKDDSVFEFEPNPKVILKNMIPLYLSSSINKFLIESKVSEMASRRMAMENSTENAKELIEQLNLAYNRVRQSKITQEIIEIVAGSNSNKKEKV